MREITKALIPDASPVQLDKFVRFYELLVDWNSRVNLTAITAPEEVAAKHFADSLLPRPLIPAGARCIDVGTGAGFPGIPLLIMRGDVSMTLVDSLAKRLVFIQTALDELGLDARVIHARAEDAGRDAGLRGKFDVALTRAVAAASTAMEWTTPFLKVGGVSLMYKGPKAQEEMRACDNACRELKCSLALHRFDAPWGERLVIEAKKTAPTPKAYPRKAGTASKLPL